MITTAVMKMAGMVHDPVQLALPLMKVGGHPGSMMDGRGQMGWPSQK